MGATQQFSERHTSNAQSTACVAGLPGLDRPAMIVAGKSQVVDLPLADPTIPRPALTDRERDVLLCWLTSDSKTAVSTALGLSDGTVKTHLHRIRGKYEAVGRNASTKAALVARALQDGLIGLEDL